MCVELNKHNTPQSRGEGPLHFFDYYVVSGNAHNEHTINHLKLTGEMLKP